MKVNPKIVSVGITISAIFIFICLIIRIGITFYENYGLLNSFVPNPNSFEPYQQQIPIAEDDFIDYYIYRFYSNEARAAVFSEYFMFSCNQNY